VLDIRNLLCAAAMMTLLGGLPAAAHHSGAMFDEQIELTLTGTVTKFDYVNPHSWLYVNVEDEAGSVTEWGFELGAPPRLRRLGVSPSFWQEGDRITLKTHPLKDGRPAGALVGSISANGTTFGNPEGLEAPSED
jgi:hypothetical protein